MNQRAVTIIAFALSASVSLACITPRTAELRTGAHRLDSESSSMPRTITGAQLLISEDRRHAELRHADETVTLTLERRSDPDTWPLSCGQHYREETFDVVAPKRMTLGGSAYELGLLTASCGGGDAMLYMNDTTSGRGPTGPGPAGQYNYQLSFEHVDTPPIEPR